VDLLRALAPPRTPRAHGHGDGGPDYAQWHGFFEVAKTFYIEFIPEAEQLTPGVTAEVMKPDYHKWTKGLTNEELQQQTDFYRDRYQQ
jgi:hydroxylamine dehydrogenase